MFINRQRKEINIKIVYYGPPASGKTTNLEKLHASIDPKLRSDLVSLKTREDRTLFFDFMQVELKKIGGFTPKIHLYTVPGQVMYAVTRKIVLQGADGVVFVADSSPHRLEENKESWLQLYEHLEELGVNINRFPIVVQFNKRDLPDAVPVPELKSYLALDGRYPCLEAQAIYGIGIKETAKTAIGAVLKNITS